MLLKALEMQGFKTFVDKIRLEFGPGITCIVGPNGSGKSNIVDALAWVLGEQSARVLRGAHMEDVIFAGSEKRRPVGLAEVTLILDNSDGALPLDYPEIAITRRIMRSGESEYKLNKVQCRLRDIQELFWDTGAGKEKFAIIGQGKLEEILTLKPEERRLFLEEVAGIARYRWRKEQVVQRLIETEQNLVRLRDILNELELQLRPLKQEADRARRHLKLVRILKLVELVQEVERLQNLAGKRDKIYQLRQEIKETLAKLEQGKDQLLRILAEKSREIEEGAIKKQELQRALQNLQTQLERTCGERELVKQKWESLTNQCREYQKEASLLEQEERLLNLERETGKNRLEALGEEEESLRRETTRLEQVIEEEQTLKSNCLNHLARLKEEMRRIEEDISLLKGERTRMEERQGLEERHLGSRKQELQELTLRLDRLQGEIRAGREELKDLEARLELLETEKHLLAGELPWQEKALKELQRRLRSLEERRQMALANLKVLYQAQREREGFGEGVKLVLAASEEGKIGTGILGVVAEKIVVPPGLERAIEIALGSSAQNIIVRSARDAEEAIKFLKASRRGRATFLPLEWLSPRALPVDARWILQEEGVLGIASELVQYQEDLKPAVQYLLGHTIIVAELKQALALAPRLRAPLRLVTLDGELIQPQGPITGGTGYKRRSFFSQTSEIRRWERELAEVNSGLTAGREEEKELTSSLEERRGQLARLEQEIATLRNKIHLLLQKISDAVEESKGLEEKIKIKKEELAQIADVSLGAGHRKKLIEEQLAALGAQKGSLEQEWKKGQEELDRVEEALLQHRQKLAGVRARLDALQGTAGELKAGLASLDRRLENLVRKRQELEKGQEEALKARDNLQTEYNNLMERIKSLTADYSRLEATLQAQEEVEKIRQEEYNQLQGQKEALSEEIASLNCRLQREEINLARLETTIEHGYQQLTVTYGPNWQEVVARPYPHLTRKAEETKTRLAAELEKLGEVNPGSIQEYKRLHDRYQELTSEIADLEGGRSALQKALQEIDAFMAQKLQVTLNAVQEAFSALFGELFGGGTAELVLTGEEDILKAGVEIMAQPPGKKTRHLALLSGGEKSLTALAFIFALLKVRPRAFCIFDEIDTALDDANVERFARLLRSFAAQTQFIVVSHRQGTMEVADVLYGVTMEEEGVSRLVSVRMEQISA